MGHGWWCIAVGGLLGWQRLRDSRAFAGQCCQVVGVAALVGRWHCHGIGAGTLVSEGRVLVPNVGINFRHKLF